jgi:uncharacterized protein YjbJ (UPF0337 family)
MVVGHEYDQRPTKRRARFTYSTSWIPNKKLQLDCNSTAWICPIRDNLVESSMDEHRVTGAARNFGGKVEESIGRATGDTRAQVQGGLDRAQGTAENLYGQTKDAANDAAEGLRRTARSVEDVLRNTIENKPYMAVALALGLGWLLGRTHRPL